MDALVKMALIKSAKYDYAEVDLDKNNLFIGANGAGKTTLLRAILYFYTANAKALGINSTKKISFLEYYFPYEESYIVYVYKKEQKYVLVTLYKSTSVKFRFCLLETMPNIETLYIKNNKAIEHAELWVKLRDLGVLSKTLNAKEYRETLYSKQSKQKFYSLFEAKEYDGFVKTLSNIFINNKVDSQAIKKVIVSSLNIEKEIDIEQIKRQLNGFNTSYEDIQSYDKNTKHIEKLVNYLDSFEGIKEEIQTNLSTLFSSKEQNFEEIKTLQEKSNISFKRVEALKIQLNKERALYKKRSETLVEQIGAIKGVIKLTKEKINYYKEHQIENKLQEFQNLKNLKKKLNLIISQKEFLTKEYEELSFAHTNMLQSIDNDFKEELNKIEKEKSDFQLQKTEEISKIKDEKRDILQDIEESFFTQEKELLSQVSHVSLELQEEKTAYKYLQKEQFSFKDRKKIQDLESLHQALTLKLIQTKHKLESKNQELEKEELAARRDEENLSQKEKDTLSKIAEELQGIKQLISPKNGTLLHNIYEKGLSLDKYIYFVKDELLHSEIDCDFTSPSMKLFELDIKASVPKSELQESLSALIKREEEEKKSFSLELQNLQKSFKNKQNSIYRDKRNLNEQIKEMDKELNSLQTQLTQLREISRAALEIFEEEKKGKENVFKENIQNIQKKKLILEKQLEELKDIKNNKISSKKSHFTKLLNTINSKSDNFLRLLETRKSTLQVSKNQNIAKQEELYEKSLLEKNIDVAELKSLTKQETLLAKEIDKVESYSSIISNYKRDTEEYIEKLKENEGKLKEYQYKKENIELVFKTQEGNLEEELENLREQERESSTKREKLEEEIQRVKNFEESASMRECQNLGIVYEKNNVVGIIYELLERISNLLVLYRENEKSIGTLVGKLHGVFDTSLNIKYSTNLLQSAYTLQEFYLDKKIEHYKDLQVTMLNQIISSSIEQYDNLMYHSSQIEALVRKITRLFKEISIGVIDELSLRYSRTNNRVIESLSRVKELNSENPNGYGVSLFNDGSGSKEMIKLLKSLRDTIELESVGSIDLEDSFVLEFKVVENGNDSRYQTSLDNIGSNGTDVLVKSMIYIAMLHIFKSKTTTKELAINVILDEIGILSQRYLKELIEFANRYNIYFINGAPDEKLIGTYKRVSLISNVGNKSIVQELIS